MTWKNRETFCQKSISLFLYFIFYFTLSRLFIGYRILEPCFWAIYTKCLGPMLEEFGQQYWQHDQWARWIWLPVPLVKALLPLFTYSWCPLGIYTPIWKGSVHTESYHLFLFSNVKFKLIRKWYIRLYFCIFVWHLIFPAIFSLSFLVNISVSHLWHYESREEWRFLEGKDSVTCSKPQLHSLEQWLVHIIIKLRNWDSQIKVVLIKRKSDPWASTNLWS